MVKFRSDIVPAVVDDTTLAALLDAHAEWFCTKLISHSAHSASGSARRETFSLRRADCALETLHGKLFLTFWGERGSETWRVTRWEQTGDKLTLHVTRRMNRETAQLEFTPRAGTQVHVALVQAAREARLAQLVGALQNILGSQVKIERARLNPGRRGSEPGRFARVLLITRGCRIFATGAIADVAATDVEDLLAAGLLWFSRYEERRRKAHGRGGSENQLWLVVAPHMSTRIAAACALLRDEWRKLISVWATNAEDDFSSLTPISLPSFDNLFVCAPPAPRIRHSTDYGPGRTAASIIALAPEAITATPSRHGETLRFHGLRFARVRRVMNRESVWFGVEGVPSAQRRRLLDEENKDELISLVESLRLHRSANAADHRHAFYSAAGESWLESLLRADVTRLDPGLVLAPVYSQLRISPADAGTRPLDLLARRHDGRLAVIELKTSEDAALPFQAADYWRRVEAHRRAGHLAVRELFGDAPLADAPPLVYVVAPTLRFARSFPFLASLIHPNIEIYRFDINEDWRGGVRVQRRTKIINPSVH